MSKLDLPHFVVTASSDITRWRFDVNAHVSSVLNDAVVLSHEQGTGSKNASAIVEEILINHVLTCRGQSIRIIISDIAAVGKNWITTIALPQHIVDQGLAEDVLVIFLENNHGKYLADMLFGQFQSRRRRSLLLSVDDLLDGFESINRKTGNVQGFAVNRLSCVDFATVFDMLGYETKRPQNFGFIKRNIHFAGACVAGAKNRFPVELRTVLGPALPDDPGMVQIATEPPSRGPQSQIPFEDRYMDVPAARLDVREDEVGLLRGYESGPPLTVPLDTAYSASGNGVVLTRTAKHVDYNGIEFRRLKACPELSDSSKPIIRRAWPKGLVDLHAGTASEEPVAESESFKCAPVSWIVRQPVKQFCSTSSDWKARYPPRNLLNAKYRKGPREVHPWIPTATYAESPFPIIEGTAACSAMRNLAAEHKDLGQSVHFLHALRAIFREMGDRDDVLDPWLQKRATKPSPDAIALYREEMTVYVERESGHPKAAIPLQRAFKQD